MMLGNSQCPAGNFSASSHSPFFTNHSPLVHQLTMTMTPVHINSCFPCSPLTIYHDHWGVFHDPVVHPKLLNFIKLLNLVLIDVLMVSTELA